MQFASKEQSPLRLHDCPIAQTTYHSTMSTEQRDKPVLDEERDAKKVKTGQESKVKSASFSRISGIRG